MANSIFRSIFRNKCPQCHKGEFWANSNPYYNMFFNKARIYETCGHCGLKYERERGYWYGAMYVGYALSIAAFVTAWVATSVLFPDHWAPSIQVLTIVAFAMLLVPVNYHFSRIIWINFFTKYDEEKANGSPVCDAPKIIK